MDLSFRKRAVLMIIHEITETAIRRSLNNLTITFQDFQLSESLMKAINRMGFEEATPIQAETIPLGLQNKDVIGQAQTGTGKTAAFGIPLVEKLTQLLQTSKRLSLRQQEN